MFLGSYDVWVNSCWWVFVMGSFAVGILDFCVMFLLKVLLLLLFLLIDFQVDSLPKL